MNIAIIEDLDSDYNTLERLLKNSGICAQSSTHIIRYKNAESFLSAFHADTYELLFLDILLDGEMNGMDAARAIREESPSVPIVFTTCESEYALEGYEVQALDFLVKPYAKERVEAILQRVFKVESLKPYISVLSDRETVCVSLDELLFASYFEHAVELHLLSGRLLRTYMRFKDFVPMLPPKSNFHCCSRGIIVNMNFVDYIDEGGFVLTDGSHIPISRAKRAEMKTVFHDFLVRKTRGGII